MYRCAQIMKRMHSVLAKCILGMQEKSSENFINRQTTPEKQKEPPTLRNWGSQGPLTIKISGNSGVTSSQLAEFHF